MEEKIISIEEVYNVKIEGYGAYSGTLCDGYKVETSKHTYLIAIDNDQCCCESWGYFSSDDDFGNYIGKTLLSVELTDKALNRMKFEESGYYDDCGGIQFVDFKMTNGSALQFAVYNAHNGYYGHEIYVLKDDYAIHTDTL